MTQLYNVPHQQKIPRYFKNSTLYKSSNSSTNENRNEEIDDLKTVTPAPTTLKNSGLLSETLERYLLTQQIGRLYSEYLLKSAEKSSLLASTLHSNHIFKHAEENYHKLSDLNNYNFNAPEYDFIKDHIDVVTVIDTKIKTEPDINEAEFSDTFDDDDVIHDTS